MQVQKRAPTEVSAPKTQTPIVATQFLTKEGHPTFTKWNLRFCQILKVKVGTLLQIQWMPDTEGCITIVGAKPVDFNMLKNLSYIKVMKGKIVRQDGNPFAFIKNGDMQCYVNPDIVQKQNLCNANEVAFLAVMDYNKKKDSWNWTCVSIIKK